MRAPSHPCFVWLLLGGATLSFTLQAAPNYRGLRLSELEKLEYDRPDDASLKMELARKYWCRDSKGLAVEHWLWVKRSKASHEDVALAKSFLENASKPSAPLFVEACQALAPYPQQNL
jgi:hypothetical protein